MSFIYLGEAEVENYFLPNNMSIEIDYGIIYWEDNKYHPFYTRYTGSCRRSKILDNENNIISEVIEKNPDELLPEREREIIDAGLYIGDEFERLINFPNGYSFKIEYWKSINERDKNFGMYDSKYRKIILFDENNKIISEMMERNPHFINYDAENLHISDGTGMGNDPNIL